MPLTPARAPRRARPVHGGRIFDSQGREVLVPVRGVHRAIRAAKDAELLAVRAEDATRLGGLVAFEARIAGVSEWPFDVGTFVRFTVFLALPLGSWIAGALVEWLVSRVLG